MHLDGDVVVYALDVAEIVVINLRFPQIIALKQFLNFIVGYVVHDPFEVHDRSTGQDDCFAHGRPLAAISRQ
ncbi:hypothetical protein AB1H94_13630 [Pseudomonas fulva]|uniref:hypothetical protein n=1 Tax=Pseudomonas fulva TaxID=47880 RepID=UPI00345D2146